MTTRPNSKSKLSRQQQELLKKRLAQRKNHIPRQTHEGTALASSGQNRLWLENELVPGSAIYNIARRWQLNGRLDIPALEKSLNTIIKRHEVLRTTIALQDDQIIQKIRPQLVLSLPVIDLTDLSEPDQAERVDLLAKEEAKRPFNLTTDPLIRSQLLRLADQEQILLFTLHHIIADGWSMNIFMGEFTQLYWAYANSQEPDLPPLSIQYADFAHWQEQQLQGSKLQQQRDYWLNQLSGLPAYLDLPTDRPRPNQQTFQGAIDTFTIPASLTVPLKALSQREGATLFMTLLAAFEILLSRYSGQKEVAVGTPVAGRNHPDLENLIGFFVNTVVLRGQLAENPKFSDFLAQTRQVVMAALSHQDISFASLVEELKPDRSLNHSPVFQVLFSVQNTPDIDINLPGLDCELTLTHSDTAKYDLSLFVKEKADELECTWEYNTALFDRETMQRMAANWQTLLAGIIAHPDKLVAALPLLNNGERQQQLTFWNDTRIPYPQEATVHRLFEIQAAQTPQQTALVFAGEEIRYDELNRRANQLARHLRCLGAGTESLVGLSLERSVEMVVGILAILKTGGAYLPLDAAYPPERLAFMLQDGQVSVLLTQRSLRDSLPTNKHMTVLCLDSEWRQVADESDENLVDTAVATNLAYVMYTSGSTGHPKGTAITHRNITRLVKGANYANLAADETFLQFAPISFDAATLEIWGSLLNGARLVIAPPQQLALTELADLIQAEAVTTLWLTAGLFHLMVDDHLAALSGLRQLMAGGDVLSLPRVQRVLQELPECQMINGYGPTENTTFTTCCPLSPTESLETAVPIGGPVSNTQVYVLDENLELAPVGVPGELYTGGDGLARGYLNQPGLTAVAFTPHPFADKPDERLYRTGDLARWLPDGRLEFLGRRDNQVKIRGYRIEQGEIETILSQHLNVRQSVVLALTSPTSDKYLTAYVLPEVKVDIADLQQHLSQRLPDYMVPATWVMMDAFPLDPNGKVDRRALPEPDLSQRQVTTELAQPTTPTEITLVRIWTDVLGIEQIGIHDNFFELGGHSLLATRIVARARDQLQQDIPLLTLFQFPTIAGLAKALVPEPTQAARPLIDATLRQEIQQIVIRDGQECVALPASFAQRRLFSLDQLEPDSPLYNAPMLINLQGELNKTALQLALAGLIARHESLRTTFEMVDETPMQVIHLAGLQDVSFVDGRQLSDAEIDQQIAIEVGQPFNLQAGPLLRVTLFQHGVDGHTLLLVLHHIITDGWSIPIFLGELIALYEEYATGTAASLAPLPIQYADFALWQRQWLQGDRLAEQLAYWHEQLSQAPATLELPTDRPRASAQTFAGGSFFFYLPPQLVSQLKLMSRQSDMTSYMIALTAYYILLYRYTGQTDIVVGSPMANRTVPEQEVLIGFFVNMLALRTDLSGNPTVEELLAQVRDTVVAAQARQDVPFEKLVDDLGLARTLSHSPLFQVSLTYDLDRNRQIKRPSLTWTTKDLGIGLVKYDLTLGLRESEQGIEGMLAYNSDLFDEATMQRMADHYLTVLEAMLTQTDQPITSLPLLTAVEQQTQQQWNQAARHDFPNLQNVSNQVTRIAESQPEKLALTSETETLTYGELNRRANQLAYYLLEQGVTTETLVGLCLERSPLTAVAALAVWKAGGTYVPLDPTYPADRLEFMLSDSQSPLLLTTSNLAATSTSLDISPVLLDDWSSLAAYPDHNPHHLADLDQLAYVIYTSGSTGQPKGVGITHRSLANMVVWHMDAFQLTCVDKSTMVSGPAFDASLWELWPGLASGATLFIPDEETRLMPDKMRDWLIDKQITMTYLPTPLVDNIVHLPWPDETPLRLMTTGGDVLHHYPPATLPFALVNNYGPTESTVLATTITLDPAQKQAVLPPIGKPSGNTQIYLLDAYLQPVPTGVVGNLYIGGTGLARGYWRRPSLTAASFIPNPFSTTPGARLYRTGDLARFLSDGNIEFMGRADHQVKIRGFRIELGEIETILSHYSGVREAAVAVREEATGHKRLIAYPVIADPDLSVDHLRTYLQTQLPAYMVPATFIPIDALPTTSNGKIDRAALPIPDSLPEIVDSYVAPETTVEQTLAEIWQSVLGLNRIGMHDNFFELGGDSILSIRIVAKAKDAGLSLTVRHLFQHQTIAELAAVIGELEETAVTSIEIITDKPAPLTPIQHWFFEQSFARPDHWNMAILLEIKRPLQQERLEQAVAVLIAHHDVLRMQFMQTDTGWQQRYVPQANGDWLRWFTGVDNASALIVEQQASLRIADGPLLRVAYFDRGSQPHQLLLIVHHLVMDGVSWRILLEDLQTAYEQLEEGTAVTLPTKTTSFQRWAHTLSQHVQSDSFMSNVDHWLDDKSAPNNAPLDNPVGNNTVATEAVLSYVLTVDETDALLHKVPAAYNTRIDEVLLTALAQANHAWTGCSSLMVNLEGHGREEILPNIDITRTIGWFTTLYPVRLQLPETGQLEDALKAIKEQIRQIPDRGMAYGLLRYLHPDHELRERLARRETADISYNYLGQFNEQTDAGLFHIVEGASASSFAPENQRPHILDVSGAIHNRQLQLHLRYSRELHHEQTIAQFGDELLRCLRDLIHHCQSPQAQGYTPSDFDKVTLSQGELDDILADLEDIF